MIPKIIHQIWVPLGESKLPPESWIKQMRTWQKLDGYEYILWNHTKLDNFFKMHFSQFIELFNSYKHDIQRLDVARYFILYKLGGIYVDLRVGLSKMPKFLKKFDLVLNKSSNANCITNNFMASSPEHDFFRECINRLADNFGKMTFSKHWDVMFSSGPCYINKIFQETKEEIEEYYVMSKSDFSRGDLTQGDTIEGNGYFTHADGGKSWCSWDSKLINAVYIGFKNVTS